MFSQVPRSEIAKKELADSYWLVELGAIDDVYGKLPTIAFAFGFPWGRFNPAAFDGHQLAERFAEVAEDLYPVPDLGSRDLLRMTQLTFLMR